MIKRAARFEWPKKSLTFLGALQTWLPFIFLCNYLPSKQEEVVLFMDRNLDTLKNILSCAEKSAKIRKTEEKAKTNLLGRDWRTQGRIRKD